VTRDFGHQDAGVITGLVYHDLNGNASYNAGEPGLESWMVFLDANGNGVMDAGEAWSVTGADGRYTFENVPPGTHRVTRVLDDGWVPTSAPSGFWQVTVNVGQTVTRHFGHQEAGIITGLVYHDVNLSASYNAGEPGLESWMVFLDANGNGVMDAGEAWAVTGADGRYTFDNVPPGTHRVTRVLDDGWAPTSAPSGVWQVTVNVGQTVTRHFGHRPVSTLRGVVYHDLNQSQNRNAGEPALAGVTVFLDLNNDGVLDPNEPRVLSNADGGYAFESITSGSYRVRRVVPSGWSATSAPNGHQVTLEPGQTVQRNFGLIGQPASLTGLVYYDLNGSASYNPGEPGLEGWTVYLDLHQDGMMSPGDPRTTTGADGRYTFDQLVPGAYRVARILQPDWQPTSAPQGFHNVTPSAGQTITRHFGHQSLMQNSIVFVSELTPPPPSMLSASRPVPVVHDTEDDLAERVGLTSSLSRFNLSALRNGWLPVSTGSRLVPVGPWG